MAHVNIRFFDDETMSGDDAAEPAGVGPESDEE